MSAVDLLPAAVDITIYIGRKFTIAVQPRRADGSIVPLTGYTAFAEVRKAENKPLIVDLAPVITSEENGIIRIALTRFQTVSLPKGTHYWDLSLSTPDGERLPPFIVGRALITPVISQPA